MSRPPKLDSKQVADVWWFYRNTGLNMTQIAHRFNVSPGVISKILDNAYLPRKFIVSEQQIEDAIQAKGLTAPRLTPSDIDETIVSAHYFTAEEGMLGAYKANGDVYVGSMPSKANAQALSLLTICVLVLRNGFTVVGKSACVSPENFNAEIGRQIAYKNAREEIWPLEGYLLADRRARLFEKGQTGLPIDKFADAEGIGDR